MTAGTTPRPPRKFLPSRTPPLLSVGFVTTKAAEKIKKMKQKTKLGSRASARCSRRAGRTRASRPRAQADARNRAPHHCRATWLAAFNCSLAISEPLQIAISRESNFLDARFPAQRARYSILLPLSEKQPTWPDLMPASFPVANDPNRSSGRHAPATGTLTRALADTRRCAGIDDRC